MSYLRTIQKVGIIGLIVGIAFFVGVDVLGAQHTALEETSTDTLCAGCGVGVHKLWAVGLGVLVVTAITSMILRFGVKAD